MPETAEEIQKAVDDYIQTVGSILAFSQTLNYECKFDSFIGKKLHTSPDNRISPDEDVTPDLVSMKDTQGIVTEVKKTISANSRHWDEVLKQLEKYDDKLSQWNDDETVTKHEIVLLTHHTKSNQLEEKLKDSLKKGVITLKRNVSIIEFVRNSERQTFFNLKLTWGDMSIPEFNSKLKNCISVNMKYLINQLSSIKFYDAEPHVVYTMSILWDHYISKQPTNEQRRASVRTNKTMIVPVHLDNAYKDLVDLFGPKQAHRYQCQVPRRSWVKKALDRFCEIKLGVDKGNDTYEIKFRNIPNMTDKIEYFSRIFAERSRENLTQFLPAN